MALVACSGSPSRAEGQWSTTPRESLAGRGTVAHVIAVPACRHLPKIVDTVSWSGLGRRPLRTRLLPRRACCSPPCGEYAGPGTAWHGKCSREWWVSEET